MRSLKCTTVVLMMLSALASGPVRGVEPSLEKDGFYRTLQARWEAIRLSRDMEYWRAPALTPGPLSCEAPAASDVSVNCDRWLDGSDMRRFGLDAVRLSGAKTDHEKALAVYRWVRRWMIFTNEKGAPTERLVMDSQPCIHQPGKLLNVYGAHWCGGQARVVELVWRALGYRAEKVCRGGHTIVGMYYRDDDGASRWHALDVPHSAIAFDKTYSRLLSLDELSTRWYSFYYQYGLPGNGHIHFDDHRMELTLRPGERLERCWSNWGKPYQDDIARDAMRNRVPESERGPYLPFTFGNGRWTYAPDLSQPDWEKGLAERPEGMISGKLQPAVAGRSGQAVWDFRTPYIVADAQVRLTTIRKNPQDLVRLYLSVDGGKTWRPVWECPPEAVGRKDLAIPICPTFEATEKGLAPPKDFNSPFGRYAYRLKLELSAKDQAEDCRVDRIEFETTVQQNMFALPQLQPGKNSITVRGRLADKASLKVTYTWDDPKGQGRQNVAWVEKTPWTYEIVAAGQKWEDCKCRAIVIEAVAATGKGNQTLVKEAPSEIHELPPLPPAAETTGRWNGQPLQKDLPAVEAVVRAAGKGKLSGQMLRAAVTHGDPRSFEALKEAAYKSPNPNDKLLAFVGLYQVDAAKARPVLLDILRDREGKAVVWDQGKDAKGQGWGRRQSWCVGGTVIGYMAAEAGWKEFLPGLLDVLVDEQCSPDWGPRYGTVRVIGMLGKGDKAAAEAIEKVLTQKLRKEHGDTLTPAALAAGQIGDSALIPALRRHLDSDYWPLKHNAALALSMLGDKGIAPRMREWLTVKWDENFRGYAAEALGNLKDPDSRAALRAALEVEPFQWVRDKVEEALKKIERPQ